MLAWLKLKAQATARALAASSPAFRDMDAQALFAYAVGLLGDYLAPVWLERLQTACSLPTAGGTHPRLPRVTREHLVCKLGVRFDRCSRLGLGTFGGCRGPHSKRGLRAHLPPPWVAGSC